MLYRELIRKDALLGRLITVFLESREADASLKHPTGLSDNYPRFPRLLHHLTNYPGFRQCPSKLVDILR